MKTAHVTFNDRNLTSINGADECGTCSQDARCEHCDQPVQDPDHLRAQWAKMVAESKRGASPFWDMAAMADAFFAPNASGFSPQLDSDIGTKIRFASQIVSHLSSRSGQVGVHLRHGASIEGGIFLLAGDAPPPPPPPPPPRAAGGESEKPGGGGGGARSPEVVPQCCVADSITLTADVMANANNGEIGFVVVNLNFSIASHMQEGEGGDCKFQLDELSGSAYEDIGVKANVWMVAENKVGQDGSTWTAQFAAAQKASNPSVYSSTDQIKVLVPPKLQLWQYYRVIDGCEPKNQIVASSFVSCAGMGKPVDIDPPASGSKQDVSDEGFNHTHQPPPPQDARSATFPGSKIDKRPPPSKPKRFPSQDKIKKPKTTTKSEDKKE